MCGRLMMLLAEEIEPHFRRRKPFHASALAVILLFCTPEAVKIYARQRE